MTESRGGERRVPLKDRLHPIGREPCIIWGVQHLCPSPIKKSTYLESEIGLYLPDRYRIGLPDVHLGLPGLGLKFAQPDLRVAGGGRVRPPYGQLLSIIFFCTSRNVGHGHQSSQYRRGTTNRAIRKA